MQKIDRRVQRTRNLLLKALMELIVEQGYDSITIQDITDRANVARTTFYLHYTNKDELLYNGLYTQFEELLKQVTPGQMDSPLDWQHLETNAAFYKTMFGEKGSQRFTVQMFAYLQSLMFKQIVEPQMTEHAQLPADLIAAYLAGAQYGLYRWWLNNDGALSIKEISQAGELLAIKGLPWALGLSKQEANPLNLYSDTAS